MRARERSPRFRPTAFAAITAGVVAAVAVAFAGAALADAETDRWVSWHRDFARRLAAQGRLSESVQEWMVVGLIDTADPQPLIRAAVDLVDSILEPGRVAPKTDGAYVMTEQVVREAIRRGGTHDPALAYAIGRISYADGDFETAQNMLGFARHRGFDPIRARLWHYRAIISDTPRLLETGSTEDAVRRLERVVKDCPDHPEVLIARINLAVSYRRRGEHVVAEKLLNEVLTDAPWAARAHLALAEVWADLSRWDEANGEYRVAMDRAQERDDGVYTGRGVYNEALLSAAFMDLRRGDLESCAVRAKQVQALQPESADTFFLLGSLAQRRGDPGDMIEAARLLRRAARLAPDRREILAPLIVALTQMGETAEADELSRKLEQIQEESRLKAEAKYRAARGPAAPTAPPEQAPAQEPPPQK